MVKEIKKIFKKTRYKGTNPQKKGLVNKVLKGVGQPRISKKNIRSKRKQQRRNNRQESQRRREFKTDWTIILPQKKAKIKKKKIVVTKI